jgi:hypothetical protein
VAQNATLGVADAFAPRCHRFGISPGRITPDDADAKKAAAIRNARKKGVGIRRIARDLGVGVGTVLRLTAEA